MTVGLSDSFLDQLTRDAPRAEPAPAGMDHLFHNTPLREPALRLERIEDALELSGVLRVSPQFAGKLMPRVLPSREQLQRPRPQAGTPVVLVTGHGLPVTGLSVGGLPRFGLCLSWRLRLGLL